MTVITKPLSQHEKNEKQSGKENGMVEVPLSDPVKPSDLDVEAPKKVYSICYTRGKKSDSSNVWLVLSVMVISCIILAILGYYQLICLRKQGEDTIRKRHEALKKLKYINKQDSNLELLNMNGLLNDPATWSHKKVPTPNLDLPTETTTTKKFHRGTCRVSCHVKQSNQQLCPRRFIQNGAPSDQEPANDEDKNSLLLLGNLGYGQGVEEEQALVHKQVEIQKKSEVEQDSFGDNGSFEIIYELDLETETFELIQMPEVSSGIYLHDFSFNRTAIIEQSRCFVMVMDRNEIAPPRTFLDMLQNMGQDGYELNLNEIQHDMRIILPELSSDEVFKDYGRFVGSFCNGKTVYKLEQVPEEIVLAQNMKKELENDSLARRKRSTNDEKMFKEISKFSINYNIVNYHIL